MAFSILDFIMGRPRKKRGRKPAKPKARPSSGVVSFRTRSGKRVVFKTGTKKRRAVKRRSKRDF